MSNKFLPHPLELSISFVAGPDLEPCEITGRLIGRDRCYGVYAFAMPDKWVCLRWTKPVVVNRYVHKVVGHV